MLTFRSFLEEGLFSWLKDSLRRISNQIKTMLTKLKPGDTARISLKHSQHLQEKDSNMAGGGGFVPMVGVLAEWVTGAELFDLIDKYNKTHDVGIKYNPSNRENVRKVAAEKFKRAHNILRLVKNPKWDGTYLDLEGRRKSVLGSKEKGKSQSVITSRGEIMLNMVPSMREKCKSSAATIFNLAVENLNDHNLTEWDIECTGQSDGGTDSTADLVINKMENGKIVDHFDVSLKTICGDPETTRGKSTSPLHILGHILGYKQPGRQNFKKLVENFPVEEYGKEIKELISEIQKINGDWQAMHGKGTSGMKDEFHEYVKSRTGGYDAIGMGAQTWVRLIALFSEKHKEEFVEALFEMLDLKPDSPVLVATGSRKQVGTVTAVKSPSPAVLKEWQKSMRKIDLRIDYDKNQKEGNPQMKWIFSINGVELPAITGQIYASPEGGMQFFGKANEVFPREDVEKTLETKFGITF